MILLFFSDSLAMSMLATVHNGHIVPPPLSFTLALTSLLLLRKDWARRDRDKTSLRLVTLCSSCKFTLSVSLFLFWIQILVTLVLSAARLWLLCTCHTTCLALARVFPCGNLPHADPTYTLTKWPWKPLRRIWDEGRRSNPEDTVLTLTSDTMYGRMCLCVTTCAQREEKSSALSKKLCLLEWETATTLDCRTEH